MRTVIYTPVLTYAHHFLRGLSLNPTVNVSIATDPEQVKGLRHINVYVVRGDPNKESQDWLAGLGILHQRPGIFIIDCRLP
jgi:hypothetical protein